MAKCRRDLLTIQQRVDVLKDLETWSISYVAEKYKVHPRTIKRIQEKGAEIYNFAGKGTLEKSRKNLRQSKYEKLEQRLFVWFTERRAVGDILSDAILIQKAGELKDEFEGFSNFKFSSGWLAKFKQRYHIRLSHRYGEKASANEHGANLFVSNFEKYIEKEQINLENIYNMDETGLLWKALPWSTLMRDSEQSVNGHEMRKDRLTVGLCANVTGTHKIMPLVIHKVRKPKGLRYCMNQLPVTFKPQINALMTKAIFVDWFENHFKKAVRQYQLQNRLSGKVILLVDNCTCHKFPTDYKHDDNFEVKILPNTKSLIQPMDQGVIEKVKRRFRHKLSQHIIAHGYSIEEFYEKYIFKDCIHTIRTSWEDLTCSDIKNAWKNIIPNMQTIVEAEEDTITSEMQQAWSRILEHNVTVEDIENYFAACSEEERTLSGTSEERVAEEGDEERAVQEGDEERTIEEGDEEWATEEGDEERAEEEGDDESAIEEGDEERTAEERYEVRTSEAFLSIYLDEENAIEEGDEERVAEEHDVENGIKLDPKIRKDFEDVFQQFEHLKKYLPPPARCILEGLKLTILGYTTSKKRKHQ